jgi:hypothetical protein
VGKTHGRWRKFFLLIGATVLLMSLRVFKVKPKTFSVDLGGKK